MSASPPSSTPSPPVAVAPSNPSPSPPVTVTPPPDASPPPVTVTPPPVASPPPVTVTPPPVSPPVSPPVVPPPSSPPVVPPPSSPPVVPPPSSPPVVPPPSSPPVVPPPSSPPVVPPPSSPPVVPPPSNPPPVVPPPSNPPPVSAPPPKSSSPPPTPDASPPAPESTPAPPDASPPPPVATPTPPDSPPASSPPPVIFTPPSTRVTPPPPIRLSVPPPGVQYAPPPPPGSNSNTVALAVGISAGAVVGVAVLLGVCFFFFYKKTRKPETSRDAYESYYTIQPSPSPYYVNNLSSGPSSVNRPGSGEIYPGPTQPPPARIPTPPTPIIGGTYKYEDLSEATSGFSESNVLGQGGFGLVYKGTLDGIEVAIKKLRSGGGQGDREFRAEVEIISRVHHKNLVSLVGFCIHDEQRLLVYEYVPNKTLGFHLHGIGRPTLDWVRRWKIALGTAKGLAYLHEDCDPKIIHRDIKAANILVDYHFEPRVSDFGLAKLVPGDNTHVSTRVMGTFGYMAPEYAQSGKLTDRSDVYSYGVMLLELITGKKPVLPGDAYIDNLVDWARPILVRSESEDVYDELVDPRLETNYDQHDMSRLIQCAHAAVRNLARKRPRMSQIVRYLEGEISLEDLNAGVKPGESRAHGGVSSNQVDVLRRMAFGEIISEDMESERSSEYTHTQSSSSHADTAELEMRRLNQQS